MIHTINQQPYLNFDEHVDIDQLMSMKLDLCAAFAESWIGLGRGNFALTAVAGQKDNWPNSSNEPYLPNYPGQELAAVQAETLRNPDALGHYHAKKLAELGAPAFANLFLKLIGYNLGIGYNLFIRAPATGNYNEKHLESRNRNTANYEKFAFFVDWIKQQNIFSEIGRIVIFFNDQDQYCLLHRDRVQPLENPDEFVWINIFPDRKKFYVFDGETGTRHYINSHLAWFDTANWHASDTSPFAAFSIRVDGVFTPVWRKKINYERK